MHVRIARTSDENQMRKSDAFCHHSDTINDHILLLVLPTRCQQRVNQSKWECERHQIGSERHQRVKILHHAFSFLAVNGWIDSGH